VLNSSSSCWEKTALFGKLEGITWCIPEGSYLAFDGNLLGIVNECLYGFKA